MVLPKAKRRKKLPQSRANVPLLESGTKLSPKDFLNNTSKAGKPGLSSEREPWNTAGWH